MMTEKLRRLAVSQLQTPEKETFHNQVLEIEGDRIVRYYPLQSELAHTEWHPWTVVMYEDGGWEKLP